MEKQAKLCLAISEKVDELQCGASTVQCWDSVENNYGCATCLAMSMMGESGKPSACESDVTGALSMLAAHLASGGATALMDWNNNLREDRNACISLHCSNFPKSFSPATWRSSAWTCWAPPWARPTASAPARGR